MVVEADGPEAEEEVLGARLAVKMFTTSHQDKGMESVMWEVHVMRQLCGHPNIVALRDTVEMADAVYLVMERIEGPDLEEHLAAQPGGRIDEATARPLFRHILAALRHAHGRGFLHRDLKPANVRLQEERDSHTAILVDQPRAPGHSRSSSDGDAALWRAAGIGWATRRGGRARLGLPADARSLGVTLYEMSPAGRLVGASRGPARPPPRRTTSSPNGRRRGAAAGIRCRRCYRATARRSTSSATTRGPSPRGPMPPALPTDAVLRTAATSGVAPSPASATLPAGAPGGARPRGAWRVLAAAAAVVFALMHYEALHQAERRFTWWMMAPTRPGVRDGGGCGGGPKVYPHQGRSCFLQAVEFVYQRL